MTFILLFKMIYSSLAPKAEFNRATTNLLRSHSLFKV